MTDNKVKPMKIISGKKTSYLNREVRIWKSMGYKVVKIRHWSDGSTTYVMEKES